MHLKIQKIAIMSYPSASAAVEGRARDRAEEMDIPYGQALIEILSQDLVLARRYDREVLGDDGADALLFNESGEGGKGGSNEPPMTSLEAGLEINRLVREHMGEHGKDYVEAQAAVFQSNPKLKIAYGSI